MLFLAKDSLTRFFSGGNCGIFSIVLVEKDSLSTFVNICKTAVSSLSNGGCCLVKCLHKR